MFGLAARDQLLSLATMILQASASEALRELNDLAKSGKDLGRLLSDLLGHFRNLMIYHYSKGDLSLMDVSEAEAAALQEQATEIAPDSLTRIMEVLADAESRLRDAASKKIFLELTLLKAIEARNASSIDTVLKKLNELRNGIGSGAATGGASNPVKRPAPARAIEPAAVQKSSALQEASTPAPVLEEIPVAAETKDAGNQPVANSTATTTEPPAVMTKAAPQLEGVWSELIEAVGRVSPFIKSYLLESHPVALHQNVFTLGFDPEFKDHLALVDTPKNRAILETKLREMGHRDASVRFVRAEAPASWVRRPAETAQPAQEMPSVPRTAPARANPPAPASATPPANGAMLSKEDFKNDPLIRKALEIFKGTIVEVRA